METELFLLNNTDFWVLINDKHSTRGGVYKIIAVEDGIRKPINRFLGTDPEGVLYIGKATSFVDRVINLKKSIASEYKGTSHICGRRYKANPNIAKLFPYGILHIELTQSDTPEEFEKKLLVEYRTTFGEVPPLNAI